MNPWFHFPVLEYHWQRLKEWALNQDANPNSMTPQERGEELGRLLNRANDLCDADKIPGRYIRIDKRSYSRWIEYMRRNNDE